MSYEQAAEAIYSSQWTVRRMERAEGGLKPLTVKSLLLAYGITDAAEIDTFLALARDASRPGWWHSYDDVLPAWFRIAVGLEEAATLIRAYEPQLVPGLLQTGDYVRAVTAASFPGATTEATERRVELRLARQALLTRPGAPGYWAVLDETVLRRPAGGPKVMRAQLAHLIQAAARPNLTLQVIPFAAGWHPALYGMFNLFRFGGDQAARHRLQRTPDQRLLPQQTRRDRPLHRGAGPHVRPGRLARSNRPHPARGYEGDLTCTPISFLTARPPPANRLGYFDAAAELIRSGWAYAIAIDHRPLLAQLRYQQSYVEFWRGQTLHSRDLAASGLEYLSQGPGGAELFLNYARAAARLGDIDNAREAIANAHDARERDYRDDVLEIGGEFAMSRATHHGFAGLALAETSGAEQQAAEELEHAIELYEAGPGPGEDHWFGGKALATIDLATIHLRSGALDAASARLDTVLTLSPTQRIPALTTRLGRVRSELAAPIFRESAPARELDERIEDFGRDTLTAELHSLPGGPN